MQLFSEEMRRDPYPVYAQMRRHGPLISDPQGQMWMVLDYEGVKRVLTEHESFSSAVAPPTGKPLDWIVFRDPPEHTRLRGILTRAFMPKSMASLEPRIRQISRRLLNQRIERGEMDLVTHYCGPLPSLVIADVIGIPEADQQTFLIWNELLQDLSAAVLANQVSYQQYSRYTMIQERMSAYLRDQLYLRRIRPLDDLITRLAEAEVEGEKLSDAEIMGFIQLLFSAATETATNLIGNAVLTFADFPDQLALLRGDPSLVPSAVEELLRYRAPIQTLIRQTRTAVELHGQTIPAGRYVFAVLGAANRDPKVFDNPDRFDIRRDPNPHIAFGHGAHYCMGVQLGRLESRIALADLVAHMQDIQIINRNWEPQKAQHVLGPAKLPIRFRPSARLPESGH